MSKQESDDLVTTAKHYTYREWRELLGLPWPPSGCSIEDAGETEVTLYPDGAAAYTDGGVSVPVREEEARAIAHGLRKAVIA